MSDPAFSHDMDQPETLRQASRDRWASPLAAMFVVAHFLAFVVLFGWNYFIVPRKKFEVDQLGMPISASLMMQIQFSDLVVNYWYIPAVLGIPFLICDFLIIRWISRQLGLSRAFAFGLCLFLLILANFAYSYYAVTTEVAQLVDLSSRLSDKKALEY